MTTSLATIRPHTGMTLLEIMLAMGLLVVGMVMVGTLFPMAILESQETNEKTLNLIIAENAAATCQRTLHAGVVPAGLPANGFGLLGNLDSPPADAIAGLNVRYTVKGLSDLDMAYPVGTDGTLYRWIALARLVDQRVDGGGNPVNPYDVQLVIIPYKTYGTAWANMDQVLYVWADLKEDKKLDGGDACHLTAATRVLSGPTGSDNNGLNYHVGDIVVVYDGSAPNLQVGQFATVIGVNGVEMTLSNALGGQDGEYRVILIGARATAPTAAPPRRGWGPTPCG